MGGCGCRMQQQEESMARRLRPPQPKGRTFAVLQTEHGEVLHKLCAGPCEAMKPVKEFYRIGESWRSWCKLCEKPAQQIRDRSEKRKAAQRESQKHRKRRRVAPKKQGCVYIVQLVERANTIKIGRTERLSARRYNLKRYYGALRLLLVIPTETPADLERHFHAQLRAFRLYEGESKTELFSFESRVARKALGVLMSPYARSVIAPPLWETPRPKAHNETQQLGLWEAG
jgi:hypothetical protein